MSNRLTCLLLEDEASTQAMILGLLSTYFPQVEVLKSSSIEEAECTIQHAVIDFFILDVNLPDGNSFDWLTRVFNGNSQHFRVVFITAYSDYALKAFQFNALDFLLKPFSPIEFRNAVEKVIKSIGDESRRFELEQAYHNLSQKEDKAKRLILKTQDEVYIVTLAEIIYLASDNNYCNFYLADGRIILISQPLKFYEKKLDGFGFVRVHQSYLINMEHISSFKRRSGQVLMSNKTELPVSANRKNELIAYFDKLT